MGQNSGIAAEDRTAIAHGLSRLLADSYSLYMNTQDVHWNVTGPMFHSLHIMTEEQYTDLATAVDEIAERIRALGEYAPAGATAYRELSSLAEVGGPRPAEPMIGELVAGHEAVARTARSIYPAAEAAQDEVTCDLLTQRLAVHEKTAWMLRSLQG